MVIDIVINDFIFENAVDTVDDVIDFWNCKLKYVKLVVIVNAS